MISPEELAAIEARVKAATAGPWTVTDEGREGGRRGWTGPTRRSRRLSRSSPAGATRVAEVGAVGAQGRNAEFIASARQDVPALVAEVRFLRGKLRVIEKLGHVACEDWGTGYGDNACPCPSHIAWRALRGEP